MQEVVGSIPSGSTIHSYDNLKFLYTVVFIHNIRISVA